MEGSAVVCAPRSSLDRPAICAERCLTPAGMQGMIRATDNQPQSSPPKAGGHVEAWPDSLIADLPADDWLAIHTVQRQAPWLSATLRRHGIPGMLFYERRVITTGGGTMTERLSPLLGGWSFVHGATRAQVWDIDHRMRVLPIRQPQVFVRELADLIALVRRSGGDLLEEPTLQPGMRVRLTAGTMQGLCGVIVRRQGASRLVVNVSAMGTSVAIEVPVWVAEAAEPISLPLTHGT